MIERHVNSRKLPVHKAADDSLDKKPCILDRQSPERDSAGVTFLPDGHYNHQTDAQCCVTGMTCQSLSSKWPAAKARRASMSFATCEREATPASGHFQLNSPGRSSLGDCQAIPVTQH